MCLISWKLKQPKIPYDEHDSIYEKLAKINGIGDIDEFLNPSEKHTHNPYLLKNIEVLVERIIKAIKNNEKIFIFGDCDYDGLASGVILYKWLMNFTENVELHYVERSTGHGSDKIKEKVSSDVDLYIAVDSSSNDKDECEYLLGMGIDCLVIDHHSITNENPFATIVNPRQEGCKYPNKNASGGLLVWKVCTVLDDYMNTKYSEEYKDLAGFAVAADMMSMMEMENRYYYFNSLNNIQHKGMEMLFKSAGRNIDMNHIYGTDFSYGVSPCITAATRADNIQLAVEFLLCDDTQELKCYVKELLRLNELRKRVQAEAIERLLPLVNPEDKVIILYDPSIGKGYNGLVAQEVMKEFKRPAIVLGDGEENTYIGSYRAPEHGFSMLDLLNSCESAIFAGGHPPAGGTGCYSIDDLRKELNTKLADYEYDDTLYYDLEFDYTDINQSLVGNIQEFYRVSGNSFEQGRFKVKNLFIADKKPLKGGTTVRVDCGNLIIMKFKTNEMYYNSFPIFCFGDVVGSFNLNKYEKYDRVKRRKYLEVTSQLILDDFKLLIKYN